MNILFSSASYVFSDHVPGGEYQVAHAIISGLASRGHHIHLIVPQARLRQSIPNVTVHEIGGYDFVQRESYFAYRWNWWTFSWRSYRAAKRILKAHPVDIVHHLRPSFPEKFSMCWRLPKPFVYGPVSLPMTASLPAGTAMPGEETSGWIEAIKNKLIDRLNFTWGQALWRGMMATAVRVPISVPLTRDYLPEICREKSPVIPLGVNPEVFSPTSADAGEPQTLDILYAGHLVPAKGVDHLIRAMPEILQQIPKARLVLVGDGPDRSRLEQIVQALSLTKCVDFQGAKPFTDMPDIFRNCTVFCLPTLAEAFGMSLLQAMACGKPVVASAVGGIPYIVEDGKSGHLVPSRDASALAQKLIELLSNPEARKAMGSHNRERVLKRYSWQPIVSQIETLYSEILQGAT